MPILEPCEGLSQWIVLFPDVLTSITKISWIYEMCHKIVILIFSYDLLTGFGRQKNLLTKLIMCVVSVTK